MINEIKQKIKNIFLKRFCKINNCIGATKNCHEEIELLIS